MFSCPLQISMNCRILLQFGKGIQLSTQMLFRKLFMNKGVATPADINATFMHLGFVELLFKPFVAMAGFWDKVMEGNKPVTAAEGASFIHFELA